MAKKNYFGHVFFRAQYRSLVDGGGDGDETFQSKLLTEFLRIFSTWQKWECENWWKECGSQIETEVSENHPFLQSNEFEIFAGRMDFIWL